MALRFVNSEPKVFWRRQGGVCAVRSGHIDQEAAFCHRRIDFLWWQRAACAACPGSSSIKGSLQWSLPPALPHHSRD